MEPTSTAGASLWADYLSKMDGLEPCQDRCCDLVGRAVLFLWDLLSSELRSQARDDLGEEGLQADGHLFRS